MTVGKYSFPRNILKLLGLVDFYGEGVFVYRSCKLLYYSFLQPIRMHSNEIRTGNFWVSNSDLGKSFTIGYNIVTVIFVINFVSYFIVCVY